MNTLYDFGYQTIKDPKLLQQVVQALDAFVLDVRLSPRSRDPHWNGIALRYLLIERYIHVGDLGNLNYKDSKAPIAIRDLEKGFENICHYLRANNVILLCACGKRNTCHRRLIADAFEKQFGIKSTPLDLAACYQLAGIEPDNSPQPSWKLF